ncbi:MAG TPA: acyl-CoA dehydrogenase family protein [Acetobacteraceae bacterium]|jgi:acyl-CoA dehydrogenase|nr:acyl-CoA dehydrogenase family protein [Acetobacteraceae bacterium]
MDFSYTEKVQALRARLTTFMDEEIYPNEPVYEAERAGAADRWQPVPVIERLKQRARAAGLWNLFSPNPAHGRGLANHEYAPLAEIMGHVPWASEVFNCSAPDTGNMEILDRFGTAAQKERWLTPLLAGEIRSCFAMTEPDIASSDATNIRARIVRDGDSYVVDGRKWWTSGAGDPRCRLIILMGKTAPDAPDKYRQQSMILIPREAQGITVRRMLPVLGADDAPHGHAEILFEGVRVPAENLLGAEGMGFEIAQARLGPGRIHHCMRVIGLAERALALMCRRARERAPFGRPLAEQGVTIERVGEARILIDQARLLVLNAAWKMDVAGAKAARQEIAMIKVAAPNMACRVIDWAIQMFGGAGMADDFGLPEMWRVARSLRILDGPDEVHRHQIGRMELRGGGRA